MTLFADVVATSEAAAATPKRTAKVAALAALLRRLEPDEVVPAVGFLTGLPHQGRIGVGWATMAALEVSHAAEP
jgi:DNA ligase-1